MSNKTTTISISHDLLVRLYKTSLRTCWFDPESDDEDIGVYDYAGGNIDDAYDGGQRTGEVMLCRELFSDITTHNPQTLIDLQCHNDNSHK